MYYKLVIFSLIFLNNSTIKVHSTDFLRQLICCHLAKFQIEVTYIKEASGLTLDQLAGVWLVFAVGDIHMELISL